MFKVTYVYFPHLDDIKSRNQFFFKESTWVSKTDLLGIFFKVL